MHSVKKDDNGWVLCPSKSLPGKFYYFNVMNGEAVWSLPDAKTPAQKDIQNVADKSHSFPEPKPLTDNENIVPISKSINITSLNKHANLPSISKSINITSLNKQANLPMFGQTSFPKYVPNVYQTTSKNHSCDNSTVFMTNQNLPLWSQGTPKVVWAPFPLMVLDPNGTQTLDQVTQTCELDKVYVHSCEMPLSKRFINYEDPKINFTEDKLEYNNSFTSTPLKQNTMFDSIKPANDPSMKKKSIVKDAVLDLKNLKIDDRKSFGTSTSNLFLQNRIELKERNIIQSKEKLYSNSNIKGKEKTMPSKEDEEENVVKLDRNDLRLFLMARKRRYTEGDSTTGSSEMKKIKTKYIDDHAELQAPKKRVTFATNSPELTNNTFNGTLKEGTLTIQTLRDLAESYNRQDAWCIVVDTKVLLDNYEFLNNFVLSDETCRLLIPEAIRRDIEAMCSGDSFGRRHVYTARQIARALKSPPKHLVVRTNMADARSMEYYNDTNMATTDDILNCCLQIMKQKYHVVLLSNDEDLLKKATVLHIHAYKFENIKDSPNNHNSICDVNTNKPSLFHSTKFQSSRSHKMFQNIPGLMGQKSTNIIQPNQKSIFDDNNSVTTEMTSEINRVIQSLDLRNKFPTWHSKKTVDAKNCVLQNSNQDNQKQPFLFQNSNLLSFENRTKDTNKETPSTNKKQLLFEKCKNTGQRSESQVPNENKNAVNNIPISNNVVKNNESNKNVVKISVENDLRRFYIRHKAMEDRIKVRVEEWMCLFSQIMEDALCYVLQNSSFRTDLILPWTLQEMIEQIRLLYADHTTYNIIVDKLLDCLSECMSDKGKLAADIKPQVFVKTIGCGVLLIQCLQTLQPDCEELVNAKQSLMNLVRTIEDPVEVEFDTHKASHSYANGERRQNYVKQPSEIIRYLKRHYEDWRCYDELAEPKECVLTSNNETSKIFRVSGKNLNMLHIDNKNTMTITKCISGSGSIILESKSKNLDLNKMKHKTDETAGTKLFLEQNSNHLESEKKQNAPVIRSVQVDQRSVVMKSNSNNMSNQKIPKNDLDCTIHSNTFDSLKTGQIVTRRVSLIKEYEQNFVHKQLNMDDLDYSDINSVYENNNTSNVSDNNYRVDDSEETNLIDISDHPSKVDIGKNDSGYNNSQNTNCVTGLLKNDNKNKKIAYTESGVNKDDNAMEKDYISISEYSATTPAKFGARTRSENDSEKTKQDYDNSKVNKKYMTDNDHVSIFDNSINSRTEGIDTRKSKGCYVPASDTSTDSGIENESHMTYSLVKAFLSELSGTFKAVHIFVDKNLNEFREEQLADDKKSNLHEKINKTQKHMDGIIIKLKSIVQRETDETVALNTLLSKIDDAVNDKRISRYRSVIRKCLEQAQNIQNALKIMLSLTDAEWDGSLSLHAESVSASIRYLNIFE